MIALNKKSGTHLRLRFVSKFLKFTRYKNLELR